MPPNCRQLSLWPTTDFKLICHTISCIFLSYFYIILLMGFFFFFFSTVQIFVKSLEKWGGDCVVEASSSWLVLQMPTKKKEKSLIVCSVTSFHVSGVPLNQLNILSSAILPIHFSICGLSLLPRTVSGNYCNF